MIKTGLYGGSFNPIHNGHVRLANHILRLAGLDEVWFMVSPQNPFKVNQTLLDDHKRLELAKLVLRRHKGLEASDYEFRLPKPSYTWNTLQALAKDYPDREFVLIIGGDNWASFPRWYHSADILSHHRVVVYPRKGSDIDPASLPTNVELVQTPLINISSTDIRKRIAEGRQYQHLVPKAVADAIEQQQLYK
ncbi:MAG: nicotinate-nucleotide adenylyltransferase [Prevotella sp.]|nr:nicotinate-nucleotide adenylyltransferase [Prevotella sp.]